MTKRPTQNQTMLKQLGTLRTSNSVRMQHTHVE